VVYIVTNVVSMSFFNHLLRTQQLPLTARTVWPRLFRQREYHVTGSNGPSQTQNGNGGPDISHVHPLPYEFVLYRNSYYESYDGSAMERNLQRQTATKSTLGRSERKSLLYLLD
jgi:hypothetical protein